MRGEPLVRGNALSCGEQVKPGHEVPIAAAYPLEKVRDAFAELEQRHTLGKIVLIP